MLPIIYYATTNSGKFNDVKRYMAIHSLPFEIHQYAIDLPEQQTLDQRAIASHKARAAWQSLKKPVLVDDCGMYLEKYNQFPGTLTKHVYVGIGYAGLFALAKDDNRASMRLTLAYCDNEQTVELFEGICHGRIVQPASYAHIPGMELESIFYPDGSDLSYSQMRSMPDKSHFFYRLRALDNFVNWYKSRYLNSINNKIIEGNERI